MTHFLLAQTNKEYAKNVTVFLFENLFRFVTGKEILNCAKNKTRIPGTFLYVIDRILSNGYTLDDSCQL